VIDHALVLRGLLDCDVRRVCTLQDSRDSTTNASVRARNAVPSAVSKSARPRIATVRSRTSRTEGGQGVAPAGHRNASRAHGSGPLIVNSIRRSNRCDAIVDPGTGDAAVAQRVGTPG
jgi:hypothetical protein